MKALQKNRADRFQDAAAFRRALRAARSGVPVTAPAASEAPTDPNDTFPSTPLGADGAFSVTGAKFLDEAPGGRLRPAARNRCDDDAVAAARRRRTLWHRGHRQPAAGLPPEREHTPRQKSRRRTWIATLVIVTVLVLAGGGLWLYNMMNQGPAAGGQGSGAVGDVHDRSRMPSKGSTTPGFKPQLSRMQHETIAKGIAVGTVPATGSSLDPNSDITLNISEGPSVITIPADLPGRTEAAARDVLRQKGLAGAPGTTNGQQRHGPGRHRDHHQPCPGAERWPGRHGGNHRVHREGGGASAGRPARSRG